MEKKQGAFFGPLGIQENKNQTVNLIKYSKTFRANFSFFFVLLHNLTYFSQGQTAEDTLVEDTGKLDQDDQGRVRQNFKMKLNLVRVQM